MHRPHPALAQLGEQTKINRPAARMRYLVPVTKIPLAKILITVYINPPKGGKTGTGIVLPKAGCTCTRFSGTGHIYISFCPITGVLNLNLSL